MNVNGRQLDFIEETHTYLVDGEKTESVTQFLGRLFPNKYSGVPKDVLKRACEEGTQVHKAIEAYCKGFDDGSDEVKDFKFLQKHYGFDVVENELPLIISLGEKTFAGTTDMIFKMDGQFCVADIKTTSELDKNYLGYQLNLYKIGVEQSYGYKIEALYGIHLKNGKRKLVKIPVVSEEQIYESVKGIL